MFGNLFETDISKIDDWCKSMRVVCAKAKEYDSLRSLLEISVKDVKDGTYVREITVKIKEGIHFDFSSALKKADIVLKEAEDPPGLLVKKEDEDGLCIGSFNSSYFTGHRFYASQGRCEN